MRWFTWRVDREELPGLHRRQGLAPIFRREPLGARAYGVPPQGTGRGLIRPGVI
jgi:hypothetical protein